MAVKNFAFRENWVGSKVTSRRTTFVSIFEPFSLTKTEIILSSIL